MANPRKFSEKIALHNQKQAEETAAFERIMQEVSVTRVVPGMPPARSATHLQPHPQAYMRQYLGGSLPNVNQIAANPQMELHPQGGFDDGKHPMRHPARFDSRMRPYGFAHRRVMPLELANRHRMGHMDGPPSPYAGPYLSPPPESNWRSFALSRTNSDSALHQSVLMNQNPQDAFNPNNPMMNQARRDFNENNFSNMSPSYKAMMESKKFEQHLQAVNRPKSCETSPNVNLGQSGEAQATMRGGTGGASSIPRTGNGVAPPVGHRLSHVTQIANNTGSLPDLTNLANLPISPHLSNAAEYDDSQSQQSSGTQNSPLYNQARSTSNLPAASAISPHLSGLPHGGPASSNRSRRHTHNGPSPLSLGSPEHTRRIKYPNVTSPKGGVKPELKSPPIGAGYPYHYSQPGMPGTGPGRGMHPQQQPGGPLRIDVSAASKVGQQPYSRVPQGASVTSPITSPTSPTSQCSQASFSPITSPRHEFTTGSNPALSEAYYRSDMAAMHPLQQQFEQFHVVGDGHSTGPPPMYSTLTALSENSVDGPYDLHGHSGSLAHGVFGMNTLQGLHGHMPNNLNKIPDIVFTGVEDPNSSKALGAELCHDLPTEYFTGEDLKASLGIDGLQMLEESNIITDPAMEDSLQLDSI